ncbi:MAG: class I SAM-dependent methyltransferase [Verrucomicrobiales bacterium]|nr:class I SAM-dependent methyltransferase [Verrucomicrobiales bacterium]
MEAELSDAEKGYAVYTRRTLSFYDRFVHGFSNRYIWKCPTEELLDLYREHISTNHLEVGVGTGLFLEKTLPDVELRLALLDANRDCLDFAAEKLERFRPELHQENLLEPLEIPGAGYDSIGLNYVLHCLPGRPEEKIEIVFDNLCRFLHEKGTLFGSSILSTDIQAPWLARRMMKSYNRKGIFSNENDSLGAVMEGLQSRFKTFNVEVRGCVVIFWGRGVRDGYRDRLLNP